jgi:hypothetical protein
MEIAILYIGCGLVTLFGIIQLFRLLYSNQKQGKNEVLDKMLENGDINSNIYIKYKNLPL